QGQVDSQHRGAHPENVARHHLQDALQADQGGPQDPAGLPQIPDAQVRDPGADGVPGRPPDAGLWAAGPLASAAQGAADGHGLLAGSAPALVGLHGAQEGAQGHLAPAEDQGDAQFGKFAERAVVVTDKMLYKLEPPKFKPMKGGIPLTSVTALSVSSGKDQVIAIHLSSGNDLVFALMSKNPEVDRVGELVGVLCQRFHKCVVVETVANISAASFRKDKHGFTYSWPQAWDTSTANNKLLASSNNNAYDAYSPTSFTASDTAGILSMKLGGFQFCGLAILGFLLVKTMVQKFTQIGTQLRKVSLISRAEVDENIGQLFVQRIPLDPEDDQMDAVVCRNYDWELDFQNFSAKYSPRPVPMKCPAKPRPWIQVDVDCLRIKSWGQEIGCNFTGVFLGAHRDVRVDSDTGPEFLVHANAVPFNIVLIVLSSTSKNAFQRQMPKSWHYMTDTAGILSMKLGGFQFCGLAILGFLLVKTMVQKFTQIGTQLRKVSLISRAEVDENIGQLFVQRIPLDPEDDQMDAVVCRNYDWELDFQNFSAKYSPRPVPMKCPAKLRPWIQVDVDCLRIKSWGQEIGCNFTGVFLGAHRDVRVDSDTPGLKDQVRLRHGKLYQE
ncbi:unnamed protein product, partial [Notodromas monacha]